MQKIKNRLYIAVLKMILYDREKLWLTGKQKSQIESLIFKLTCWVNIHDENIMFTSRGYK